MADSAAKERIAVIGLGGGGGRVLACMASDRQLDAEVMLAVADTDPRALATMTNVVQVQMGQGWTGNSSTGDNSTLGEKAAVASMEDLAALSIGADLVIVVAALGKGTGAGAARALARQLRQANLANLFIVTLPFSFEGSWRCATAQSDLEELRRISDAVLAIPLDMLFSTLPADTVAAEAFTVANQVLADDVKGLIRMTRADALLPVDFATLRNLLREKPALCTLGFGQGRGLTRISQALASFTGCPMLGGPTTLAGTDAAVITLVGGLSLTVGDIQNCFRQLQEQLPPTAKLLVGAFQDATLAADELHLTGMFCRFGHAVGNNSGNQPSHQTARPDPKHGKRGQGELTLIEQSAGIFAGTPPTIRRGENLDIPTYQRRGIDLSLEH